MELFWKLQPLLYVWTWLVLLFLNRNRANLLSLAVLEVEIRHFLCPSGKDLSSNQNIPLSAIHWRGFLSLGLGWNPSLDLLSFAAIFIHLVQRQILHDLTSVSESQSTFWVFKKLQCNIFFSEQENWMCLHYKQMREIFIIHLTGR